MTRAGAAAIAVLVVPTAGSGCASRDLSAQSLVYRTELHGADGIGVVLELSRPFDAEHEVSLGGGVDLVCWASRERSIGGMELAFRDGAERDALLGLPWPLTCEPGGAAWRWDLHVVDGSPPESHAVVRTGSRAVSAEMVGPGFAGCELEDPDAVMGLHPGTTPGLSCEVAEGNAPGSRAVVVHWYPPDERPDTWLGARGTCSVPSSGEPWTVSAHLREDSLILFERWAADRAVAGDTAPR